MIKRITVLKKEYLERGLKGYFKPCIDYIILYNKTDNAIRKILESENEKAKSRFYEICGDFKVTNDKQKALFIEFLAKNYKEYRISYLYYDLVKNGLDFILNKEV